MESVIGIRGGSEECERSEENDEDEEEIEGGGGAVASDISWIFPNDRARAVSNYAVIGGVIEGRVSIIYL